MQNLYNPKWLLAINTLPILLMLSLYIGEYSIIKTLLNERSVRLWTLFGLTIGFLGAANLAYAVYLIIVKRSVSVLYAVLALLCYIPFIYVFANYLDDIVPFDIPRWMVSDDISIYAGTFLMPTLAHALFLLVAHFTRSAKDHRSWKNLALAALVPLSWYLFYQLILPLWQPLHYKFKEHLLVILTIIGTLVFLFFLVRGIYILAHKKGAFWKKYALFWKVPICILFPILGLAANNGHLFWGGTGDHMSGIFGNFNDPWYVVLAICNGVLLCIPELNNTYYRLILFLGKSITFSFSCYFFIVFLPFLPLSVLAIILVGFGFLMLTPLALFIVHIKALSTDFDYLKSTYSKGTLRTISVLGFLLLPLLITLSYRADKRILEETLAYVYTPDYTKDHSIDTESLGRTLKVIKQHKDGSDFFLGNSQTPYLSTYFKWLVLDNLTLSDSKIATIENIFIGDRSVDGQNFGRPRENIRDTEVSITDISSKSTYDEKQNIWTSWIDMEISNANKNPGFSEYATTIELPEGCYINDYYLYVGDRREMGILAEKKSAMWVFSNIRNENRDPGILYYLKGHKVAFRVFPFSQNEVRKTGIKLLHREAVELRIDDCTVRLGRNKEEEQDPVIETENLIYVSAKAKEKLPKVKRRPYFHFMVDASKRSKDSVGKYTVQIRSLLAEYPKLSKNAQISRIGTGVSTQKLDADWAAHLESQKFEGGFYLDRALKKTFVENREKEGESYPVLVVVTDSLERAVLGNDYSDFKTAFPESNRFYHLKGSNTLEAHSLVSDPLPKLARTIPLAMDKTVLRFDHGEGRVAYLPDDGHPSIVLKRTTFDIDSKAIQANDWRTALLLRGQWESQLLHPETAEKEWLNLVKNSFLSKIMTPVTSYLVVENEAQKAILKKKQAQILAGNKSLDPDEDTPRMSEPGLIVTIVLFLLFLWLRKGRKPKVIP